MTERPARTKGDEAFRTISEAAEEVGVAPHVLRFWETKFSNLRPLKRGGSRRYYRPRDIELLHRIKRLLHEEGYTIKGASKALRAVNAQTTGLDRAASRTPTEVTVTGTPSLVADQTTELARVKRLLDTLAAECASVAAGNSPAPGQD